LAAYGCGQPQRNFKPTVARNGVQMRSSRPADREPLSWAAAKLIHDPQHLDHLACSLSVPLVKPTVLMANWLECVRIAVVSWLRVPHTGVNSESMGYYYWSECVCVAMVSWVECYLQCGQSAVWRGQREGSPWTECRANFGRSAAMELVRVPSAECRGEGRAAEWRRNEHEA